MRRDMDEVRQILKTVADSSQKKVSLTLLTDDIHSLEDIAYQAQIMSQAGLVEASLQTDMNGNAVGGTIGPLTWAGNDFLDAVRSNSVWKKVKQTLARTVGSASMAVIVQLAEHIALKTLGL